MSYTREDFIEEVVINYQSNSILREEEGYSLKELKKNLKNFLLLEKASEIYSKLSNYDLVPNNLSIKEAILLSTETDDSKDEYHLLLKKDIHRHEVLKGLGQVCLKNIKDVSSMLGDNTYMLFTALNELSYETFSFWTNEIISNKDLNKKECNDIENFLLKLLNDSLTIFVPTLNLYELKNDDLLFNNLSSSYVSKIINCYKSMDNEFVKNLTNIFVEGNKKYIEIIIDKIENKLQGHDKDLAIHRQYEYLENLHSLLGLNIDEEFYKKYYTEEFVEYLKEKDPEYLILEERKDLEDNFVNIRLIFPQLLIDLMSDVSIFLGTLTNKLGVDKEKNEYKQVINNLNLYINKSKNMINDAQFITKEIVIVFDVNKEAEQVAKNKFKQHIFNTIQNNSGGLLQKLEINEILSDIDVVVREIFLESEISKKNNVTNIKNKIKI